jgi:hypothetical protein
MASVLSAPGRAPKLVMGKSRAGKRGGLMRARMAGTASQPTATRRFDSRHCAAETAAASKAK